MTRVSAWLVCAAAMLASSDVATAADAVVHAGVSGQVQRAAMFAFPVHARLSDAVLAAMPDDEAYLLGASLLRQPAREAQIRLKAGLLYDLDLVIADAGVGESARRSATALRALVDAMPVTGRVPTPLEPRRLEIDPLSNVTLAEGDTFVFPARPSTIRVLGAVAESCELPHEPMRDAGDYLQDCPRDAAADHDRVYIMQPDGHVESVGVALWNRDSTLDHALAPGATIHVPLRDRRIDVIAPRLDQELVDFIATQPLPAEVAR